MTKPRGRRRGLPPDALRASRGAHRAANRPVRDRTAPAPPPPVRAPARAAYPAYARPSVHPGPGPHREPRVPKGTGDMRRYLAVGLDAYLCLLAVGLLVHSCLDSGGTGHAIALLVVQLIVLSFANQVLLTMAVRASAGKLIMGVRVIRLPDAGRPGFRRLVLRWLYGLLWLPLQPWRRLRGPVTPRGPERPAGCPAEPCEDLAGVRQVRRSDLRSYRAAVRGRTD
ncbi:hypothetical protein GCM10010253_32870 [Streptomyces badius]|uniref:RDD domain-containing protein n=2 Tax=Streptomyces TaxID=1883 RepID=A0ABQ2T726_STRBA|nr:hypothetical protein GCM10010253_32870 [Streptomyces badius]